MCSVWYFMECVKREVQKREIESQLDYSKKAIEVIELIVGFSVAAITIIIVAPEKVAFHIVFVCLLLTELYSKTQKYTLIELSQLILDKNKPNNDMQGANTQPIYQSDSFNLCQVCLNRCQ